MLEPFLSGAICMGFLVASMFFVQFWTKTRDRLFLFFSLAFALLLVERVVRAAFEIHSEWLPAVYMFRLVAYGMILFAVFDKNRRA